MAVVAKKKPASSTNGKARLLNSSVTRTYLAKAGRKLRSRNNRHLDLLDIAAIGYKFVVSLRHSLLPCRTTPRTACNSDLFVNAIFGPQREREQQNHRGRQEGLIANEF